MGQTPVEKPIFSTDTAARADVPRNTVQSTLLAVRMGAGISEM